MNIMLDLETFGQKPGALIKAIGAVKFGGGELREEFYERIDAASAESIGLRMDVATVMWWLGQSEAARSEITQPGKHIAIVLQEFRRFVAGDEPLNPEACIWGNGSEFDNVLLATAYDYAQITLPWKYYNNRCYRTVKNLFPDFPKPEVVAHHALADAKAQAVHLMQMIPSISL